MAEHKLTENASQYATFAGGCFWCIQERFEGIPGVIEATAGYMGGNLENPSYEDVVSGKTGHREVVRVKYDPSEISYRQLLDLFWKQIDPTDEGGQFYDRGDQYTTAVYYYSEEQKTVALISKAELQKSSKYVKPIATRILPATRFYKAEAYHQSYYRKNPAHYYQYKKGSGKVGTRKSRDGLFFSTFFRI